MVSFVYYCLAGLKVKPPLSDCCPWPSTPSTIFYRRLRIFSGSSDCFNMVPEFFWRENFVFKLRVHLDGSRIFWCAFLCVANVIHATFTCTCILSCTSLLATLSFSLYVLHLRSTFPSCNPSFLASWWSLEACLSSWIARLISLFRHLCSFSFYSNYVFSRVCLSLCGLSYIE